MSDSPRRQTYPYHQGQWRVLAPLWQSVLDRSDRGSAFLSTGWVGSWIAAFGDEYEPTGLVWFDGEEPVGCALVSFKEHRHGPIPVRRCYLNASADPFTGCEHNDILSTTAARSSVLRDLVSYARAQGTDELALVGFDAAADTELGELWGAPWTEGFRGPAPFVDLQKLREGDKPYLGTLSSNTRSQVRRSQRRYEERFGEAVFEVSSSLDQAEEWFAQLKDLHHQRWNTLGEQGAFTNQRELAFHRLLLSTHSDGGIAAEGSPPALHARILRLRFGDEVVGVLYTLEYGDFVDFYQSGLKYHDDNRLKPGLVSHVFAVQHYMEQGSTTYDFLGGNPDGARYKRSLSTDVRSLAWTEYAADNVRMRLIRGLRLGVRRLRTFRDANAEGV